ADQPANGGKRQRDAEHERLVITVERQILHHRRRRDDEAQKQEVVEVEHPSREGVRQDLPVDRKDLRALAEEWRHSNVAGTIPPFELLIATCSLRIAHCEIRLACSISRTQ